MKQTMKRHGQRLIIKLKWNAKIYWNNLFKSKNGETEENKGQT